MTSRSKKRKPKPVFKEIPLDLIDPPRVEMRSIMLEGKFNELIASIKSVGVIEPIVVRQKGERYEVVVGDRRYEAAKAAGLATIPAVVKPLSDGEVSHYMLSENLIREDPNPYDVAVLLSNILREEDCTQVELGERVGWSQQKISYYMEVLKMPDDLRVALQGDMLNLHQARQLNKIDNTEQRKYYTRMAVDSGASVRTISLWVQDYLRIQSPTPAPSLSGHTEEIRTAPPVPEFRCFCCGKTYPAESGLIIRVDGGCHSIMRKIAEEAQRIEQEESMAEEEAGERGPEPSPELQPGDSGEDIQGGTLAPGPDGEEEVPE